MSLYHTYSEEIQISIRTHSLPIYVLDGCTAGSMGAPFDLRLWFINLARLVIQRSNHCLFGFRGYLLYFLLGACVSRC